MGKLNIEEFEVEVEILSSNTAVLKSITPYPEYKFNDMVLYNKGKITQVIKSGSITKYIQFINCEGFFTNVLTLLKKYFADNGSIHFQQITSDAGFAAVSFPLSFDEDDAMIIIKQAPIHCNILESEKIEDEDEEEGLY